MLTIAAKRAKKLGRYIDLKIIDSAKLKFNSATFDTVVSSLSLCTYPNPLAALREMKRVTKPNGKLLFLEHDISSSHFLGAAQRLLSSGYAKLIGCRWDRNPMSLLNQTGLAIVSQKRVGFGIFYVMIAKPQ